MAHEVRKRDHQARERGQVRSEACEQGLELRNHEQHDGGRDHDCHQDNGYGINKGLLDFAFDRLGLFLVGGDFVQEQVEHTGLFARRHQIADQIIEISGMLA